MAKILLDGVKTATDTAGREKTVTTHIITKIVYSVIVVGALETFITNFRKKRIMM